MSEKGILVSDAATGESVACRDAVELDDDSNARVIQRVDVGKGPLPDDWLTAALRSGISAAETYSVSSWPSFTTEFVTVGDKSTLIVQVQSDDEVSSETKVLPVIVRPGSKGGYEILSILQESVDLQTLQPIDSWGTYTYPLLSWDVLGAGTICIIIPVLDSSVTVSVYACVI